MKQDNFKTRYLIKVSSSIILALLNIIIQLVLPRAFSVEEYGFYNYNLNVFTSIVTMANLSTSNALVAKYSKRNNDIGLMFFYLKFYVGMSVLLNVMLTLSYPLDIIQETFAGQTFAIVLLGMETAILNKLITDTIAIYDAVAISRFPAIMQVILKTVVSVVMIIGYLGGKLNIKNFYCIQIFFTLCVVLVLLGVIIKVQKQRYPVLINLGTIKYVKEFYIFCKPLVLATIVNQGMVIIMNWALMKWSGATEQALFGAAWQMNTLLNYVFSPYAELSKREFAVLYDEQEKLKMRFEQSLKIMFWLTSYFAIFTAFTSKWLLPIIYGEQYIGATLITGLIMFYTIYQAWGQICGSYMLALELTKANAVIAIIGQVLTLGAVFVFQIPNVIWESGLGSMGIALNYLIVNIIGTTISVSYASHSLKLPILKTLAIQIPPIIICSIISIGLRYILDRLIVSDMIISLVAKVLIAGIIYTFLIIIIWYRKPDFLGVPPEEIKEMIIWRRKK